MKTRSYRLLLAAALALTALTACDTLSSTTNSISLKQTGVMVERSYEITGFDRIQASHSFDVIVTQGDVFSVALTVDESAVQYLDVRKTGEDTLRLSLDSANNYSINKNLSLIATITLPALRGIELSGASTAEISGFEAGDSLDAQMSGASTLGGAIIAGDVSLNLSGSSRALLSGSAQDITLQVSGASVAELMEFDAQNVTAQVSGSSRVQVRMSGTLDVQASGSSEVIYTGDVTLGEIETSGGSLVSAG